MIQIKKITYLSLSLTALAFLAGCTQTQSVVTNTNTNTVVAPSNKNVNVNTANSNVTNTNTAVADTSDWKTYTNDEYVFSFKYPKDWVINEFTQQQNIRVSVINIDEVTDTIVDAPSSVVGPATKTDLFEEVQTLSNDQPSQNGGFLKVINNGASYRYFGYIEGGALAVRYLAKLDSTHLLEIKYYEGDNDDYSKTLKQYSRQELLNQYLKNNIENKNLSNRYKSLENIVTTLRLNF